MAWGLGGVGWEWGHAGHVTCNNVHYTSLYQRHKNENAGGKFQIYDLGVAAASKSGKPPPESALRVRATGALKRVLTTQKWSQKHLGDRWCPMLP